MSPASRRITPGWELPLSLLLLLLVPGIAPAVQGVRTKEQTREVFLWMFLVWKGECWHATSERQKIGFKKLIIKSTHYIQEQTCRSIQTGKYLAHGGCPLTALLSLSVVMVAVIHAEASHPSSNTGCIHLTVQSSPRAFHLCPATPCPYPITSFSYLLLL